jgi:mannose-6-phosphate isomerase-like protein (cupin superfamily)
VDLQLSPVGLEQTAEAGWIPRREGHAAMLSKPLTVVQMHAADEIHRPAMNFRGAVHLPYRRQREEIEMTDFTIRHTDEMETIFDGIVHRARASLGATALGMQVMHFPAGWEGYPNHDHVGDSADENDLGQEEIYIVLDGSATLLVDGAEHRLEPGVFARVGAAQKRRILPGPNGFRMVAVGGRPGEAYRPPAWTELGGPLPIAP